MKVDVLVVGDYCFDLILMDLPEEPIKGREIYARNLDVSIGGGTFPTAVALRRLGLDAAIHMQLGTDFFSLYVREAIERMGFNTALLDIRDQRFRRLTIALSYPDDRAFLSYADKPPMEDDEVRYRGKLLQDHQVAHVHFAHLSAALAAQELIADAKKLGITLSTDCGWNPWALDHPRRDETIAQMNVFLPNEIELTYITNTEDLTDASDAIAAKVPVTVVKLGSKGSYVASKTEQMTVPAIPVDVVDTTAAGDCFNAGFLYGWVQGFPLEKALRCGNICGGLSTTASGWEATPTREQLEDWLER
ncbi:MAG: hypothetical protein GTO18_08705 [Anaerolineales bacterium]|nr:hypothetical protein [Anaerolineales bacterium]